MDSDSHGKHAIRYKNLELRERSEVEMFINYQFITNVGCKK